MFRLTYRRLCNCLFESYVDVLYAFPKLFIILPTVFCLILSSGLIEFGLETDTKVLFTPFTSRSHYENDVGKEYKDRYKVEGTEREHLNISSFGIHLRLLSNNENVNILDNKTMSMIEELDYSICNRVTFPDLEGNMVNLVQAFNLTQPDNLCGRDNEKIFKFFDLFHNEKLREEGVNFTYPVMKLSGNSIYLPHFLLDVETNAMGELVKVGIVSLDYRSRNVPKKYRAMEEGFKEAYKSFIKQWDVDHKDDGIDLILDSADSVGDEFLRLIFACIPHNIVSLALLTMFSFCVTFNHLNPERSYSTAMLFSIVSSAMAIPSSFGVLFLFGIKFHSMMATGPFITIAIGIDDAYVLISAFDDAYHHHTHLKKRLRYMLRHAGIAIFVTSLTDAVAFGVGALMSNTVALSSYCLLLTLSIILDFFNQITFFPAVLILCSRSTNHSSKSSDTVLVKETQSRLLRISIWIEDLKLTTKLQKVYIKLLKDKIFRSLVMGVYLAYLIVSIYGTTASKLNFNSGNLFMDGSKIQLLFSSFPRRWKSDHQFGFIVSNVPDVRDAHVSGELEKCVNRLEGLPFSTGPAGTDFWLRDFENYKSYVRIKHHNYYSKLKNFLELSVYTKWNETIHWKDDEQLAEQSSNGNDSLGLISEMSFRINYFGLEKWTDRFELLGKVRQTVKECKPYNVTPIYYGSSFVDLVDNMRLNSVQTMGLAFVAIALIALIMLPNVESMLCVTFSILSIDAGVVGLLMLWGADLDPMSTVDIVMSIGFSIDYTAHICYQFYINRGADRIEITVLSVGRPLINSALSTIIGISCIFFVPAYISRTLAKSVILVASLGLIHALVIIPVWMQLLDRRIRPIRLKRLNNISRAPDLQQDNSFYKYNMPCQKLG